MTENYNSMDKIIQLIKTHFSEELNEQQKLELETWINESEANKLFFEKLKNTQNLSKQLIAREQFKTRREWNTLKLRLNYGSKTNLNSFLRYAAAAIIILCVAAAIFQNKYSKVNSLKANNKPQEKAILTLANGEKIILDNNTNNKIITPHGVTLNDSTNQLTFSSSKQNSKTSNPLYNTITIPRGGNYKLKLEDGTVINLNSDSELKFPEHFADNIRQIELKGEAYLKVSKDKKRPFIIKTNNISIEVLGTEFNVCSYNTEQYSSATLVEGSIKITTKNNTEILTQGQQALVDKENNMSVKSVDTSKATSWVRGILEFENDRLEDILRVMSRCYDVDFKFNEEYLKEYRLTGKFNKTESINQILSIIQKINIIEFDVTNKQIEVKKIDH